MQSSNLRLERNEFKKEIQIENLSKEIRRCLLLSKYEPRSEKTGLRGFRPGPIQTRLYSHRRRIEA